jgi:hypothetical protein
VLDSVLFGLKILLLILLYLFVWLVARSAGRDLRRGSQGMAVASPAIAGAPALAVAAAPVREDLQGRELGAGVPHSPAQPRLVVERSPLLDEGTELLLRDGLTLGRSESSDLPLDDPFVSTEHVRIARRGQYFYVEDVGSTNGTFVNEKQVREAQLGPNVRLRVGETVFRYEE